MSRNPTPEHLFASLRDEEGAVWLDGGAHTRSIVAWGPTEVVQGDVDFREAGRSLQRPGGRALVIGAIGYGAGHHVEQVPAGGRTPEPPVWLGRFEHVARWDGVRWETTGAVDAVFERAIPLEPPAPAPVGVARSVDEATYVDAVRRIQRWILDGDCYQVNLSRTVHVDGVDPWATYRRLRANDAAFGAYLVLPDGVRILSNSPELLLAADGHTLRSDPIKGTRPRTDDVAQDQRWRDELWSSPKDHAELAMIVDLVRNDLGRVARLGSVVAGQRVLTSHGNVHHTSWPVTAELDGAHDAWDALGALFPPGSVVGTPKIRAAQRIAELEPEPRGIYCGSIGFCSDDGEARWSVAIRTGVSHGPALRYHVGGGVVFDSDAHEEYAETVAKGAAWARSTLTPR